MKSKFVIIYTSVLAVAFVLAWLVLSGTYFKTHFIRGTMLNGVNVTGMTVENAEKILHSDVSNYILPVYYNDMETDRVSAERIGLKSEIDKASIDRALEKQNSYLWLVGSNKNIDISNLVEVDNELFSDLIPKLNIVKYKTDINKRDKTVYYENGEFKIQNAVYEDDDNSKLTEELLNAVTTQQSEFHLENTPCCKKLVTDENRDAVQTTCDKANKILSVKIVLQDSKCKYNIDKNDIAKWIDIDENFNVTINKSAVENYANKWNTRGSTRRFLTSHGDYVDVVGGDYGWKADISNVANNIYIAAENCTDTVINLPTTQWALDYGDNDIGNSYVEVDLTNQYLYLYIDGKIKVKTPVVTGYPSRAKNTPQGVYRIKSVCRNVTLVGADYRTPVSYWMPFNGGIGLHDATWQYKFGGDWYKAHGSHGCVNLPLNAAALVYNEVFEGMPVVCYYYDRLPQFQAIPSKGNVISLNPGANSAEYKDYRNGHKNLQGNLENKALADKKNYN